ncbi:SpoIIAA family protein [Spongorhabdus nitratireducens]
MIEILPQSTDDVLGYKISGKVTGDEEKYWLGKIEQHLKEHKKLRMLVILDDNAEWDMAAGYEDFKWISTHTRQMEKIAFVTSKKLWKWWLSADKPFARLFDVHLDNFDPDELDEAWAWVKS